MTREIKFRAWDNQGNRMIHEVSEVGFGLLEDSIPWLVGDDGNIEWFELMQYTGLKDKTGKDIYEGDIVKSRNPEYSEPREVIYLENMCRFQLGYLTELYDDDYGYEVIGNIYENPELLVKEAR